MTPKITFRLAVIQFSQHLTGDPLGKKKQTQQQQQKTLTAGRATASAEKKAVEGKVSLDRL